MASVYHALCGEKNAVLACLTQVRFRQSFAFPCDINPENVKKGTSFLLEAKFAPASWKTSDLAPVGLVSLCNSSENIAKYGSTSNAKLAVELRKK